MTKKGMALPTRQTQYKFASVLASVVPKAPARRVHRVPADLWKALAAAPAALAVWENITPLARNEWICWVTSGKKSETREIRIEKALSKLRGGMHRPCCWAGCPHRLKKS